MTARRTGPGAAAPAAWTVLAVEAATPAAEALAERLRGAFGREPVILQRPAAARAWVELYFERRAEALGAARAVGAWPEVRVAALRGVRARDWRRFWRRHFRAQAIGARLAVVPAWQRASARRRWPRRRAVVLDPGLSFGTGDHFTTRFCLEQIDARCAGRPPRSLLDVGTGSGVLAIAAAKLGVARVVATDHDPQALAAAARNARANRVAGRVRLEAADIAVRPPRGRFDIVCANLHGRLLAGAAPRLAAACRRVLVASGLREEEADAVAAAFAAEGLVERVRDGDGEWCGLVLER